MRRKLFVVLLSLLLLPAFPGRGNADSASIPIQGFVIDSESGNPLEEILSVTFNLYETCDDEEAAYSETQSVEFLNGLYGTSLEVPDEVIEDSDTLCLGVQLEGDSEMSPRMEYFSVPYARLAQQAETANIADVALSLDSTVLSDLVGSGLDVSGSTISLDTSSSQTWTATQTYSSQVVVSSDPADTSSANASFKVNPSSSSTDEKFFVVQNNGTDRFTVDAEGDVTITGNLTVTGSLGGSGLGDITGVTAGTGLTGGGTSGDVTLSLNTAATPTWTGSHTFESSTSFSNDVNFSLVDDEQLAITTLLDGTDVNDSLTLSLTNATTSGSQRGVVVTNNASTGTTDSLVTLSNADTDTAVTSGITISSSGGGFTNLIDTPSIDITGTGAISGATGLTSSGTITLSGLTSCTALETNGSGVVACGTASTGDITGVTAGTGLSGGGTSGDVTLSTVLGTTIESSEITDDTISASDLSADSVNSSEIATDAVGSGEISADAVGSAEISADAVGSSEIAADAVGTSEIATDGVASAEITADAVGSSELASTSVTAGSYTIASITVDADGRVTSASSGAASGDISSVGSCSTGDCFIDGTDNSLIFEGSTTDGFETTLSAGDPTADRSITLPDAAGELSVLGQSIDSSEITNDTITTSDIAADGVGSSEIAADAVGTSEIATDGVASAEIAADAVGSSELVATAVTAGTYTLATVTVDADGRLTSASSGAASGDISSVGSCSTGDCFIDGTDNSLIFEGTTTDGFETTLSAGDPTADRSITLPDAAGELSVLGQSIDSSEITNDTITTSDIAADGVGSSEIVADAVGTSEIATDGVASAEIAADAVGSSELVATAVTAGTYTLATVTVDADGRLTSASSGAASGDISSVGSCSTGDCFIDGTNNSLIFEGATTDGFETTLSAGDPTADRSITLPDAAGELSVLGQSIDSSEITNDTITTSDIAADGVGSSEIVADAVGTSEIATDGVASAEIAADAVGSSELASTSVTAGSYTLASITVDADGRITSASSGSSIPDMRHFSDTTSEAWADNTTTDLWDGTQPNITPSASTSEVLVMVTVEVTAAGANDADIVGVVRRETDGTDAACSDTAIGPQVGVFHSSTSAQWSGTSVFVDTPSSTNNVRYTLCTHDDSTLGSTMNATRIDFTLYEVNDAADLAEVYPTNDTMLKPGEIVSLDPLLQGGVRRTEKTYDSGTLGVVSTKPASVIGGTGKQAITGVPVALVGRVPVRVTTHGGKDPIEPGDFLTASEISGVAMKAKRSGQVIGKALGLIKDGDGMVLLFVEPGYRAQ